jgi:hypothetical protein
MSTADFKLSPQQIQFFQTFGYLGFPGLLADRIGQIIQDFEDLWAEHGGGHGGKKHDGTQRSCLVPFIDQSAKLSTLLDDPRILGIASSLMGDDFNYMGSDGNYYVGETGWHSDGWNPKQLHIKIAFYLDPVGRNSGALRVIPGSHKIGDAYAEDLNKQLYQKPFEKGLGVAGNEIPAIALETQPGDLVCFNHNTKHASFHGSKSRRMFTMNFCQRYAAADLHSLREYINGAARFWIDRAYGEKMVATAGPGRMRHLEQVLANDYELPELVRQARAKMAEPSRG